MSTLSVMAMAFEWAMELKYGAVGAVAALLLMIGFRAHSEKCLCIGVVILVLLLF